MIKTFNEFLFEATLRKASDNELNVAAAAIKAMNSNLYKDVDSSSVMVDDKTGDIYFTTVTGVRFAYHASTGIAQELYVVKKAA